MRDRPILFSSPMICALLAGGKTQTRRVVTRLAPDRLENARFAPKHVTNPDNHLCPYGVPGDHLWGKETWRTHGDAPLSPCASTEEVVYRADAHGAADGIFRWRPSIFMPRWASRILLEVTAARVEQLQSISAADAWAEGIARSPDVDPVHEYSELWDRINGAGAWAANPWVWAMSFRVVKPERGNV